MRIALIAKPGHFDTGVSRYVEELKCALELQGHQVSLVYPSVPFPKFFLRWVKRTSGFDLEAFFNNYSVWARYPRADIYHITSQNLATLLLIKRPPGKTIVTIHDIIPWLLRKDPELRIYAHFLEAVFDRLALIGLCKADGLIAVSIFTQASLHQFCVIPTN